PPLDGTYPLAASSRDAFARDGHVQVEGEGGGPDAVFDVTLTGMTLRYETRAHRPPEEVLLVAEGSFLVSEDTITVADRSDGCTVTYDADLRLKGLARVADPLLGLAFGRIGDRAADGLRAVLDGSFVDA
ncbi:MAG: SRPBCC family protein, partial [Actinomycetota bacterium]